MNQLAVAAQRPMWRRIVAFPLVSLVIAMLALIAATVLSQALMGLIIGLTGHLSHTPTRAEFIALLQGPYLIPGVIL